MSHAREHIRAAVDSLLVAAELPGVTLTRSRQYRHTQLPAIAVYTRREAVDLESATMGGAPRVLERRCEVAVEVRVEAPEGIVDAELDDLTDTVEAALGADDNLAGLVQFWELIGVEIEFDSDLAEPIGLATLLFRADYRVFSDAPGVFIS